MDYMKEALQEAYEGIRQGHGGPFGSVVVKDGEIVDKFYSLIQPEPDYYSYWNTRVHGLTQKDTMDAPVFPKVWEQVEPLIEGLPLVAHNARFDEGCLKAVFKVY